MITKICCTCRKEKPVDCFSRNKNSKDGFKEYCKECAALKGAQYREKNRERINERKRIAYEKSKSNAEERTLNELKKGSKVCTVCGTEKPISEFYKRGNGGFFNYCKECANNSAREYYNVPKNFVAIHHRKLAYDKVNKDKISEYNKQYYKKHIEEVKERAKRWNENNPEVKNECSVVSAQKSRSIKNGLKTDFTRFDWFACKAYFRNRCAYCGKEIKKATQEHVIPVAKGGAYTVTNIIPVCNSCNLSKKNKDLHEWYPQQPFYSKEREDNIKAYFELVEQANTERAT